MRTRLSLPYHSAGYANGLSLWGKTPFKSSAEPLSRGLLDDSLADPLPGIIFGDKDHHGLVGLGGVALVIDGE